MYVAAESFINSNGISAIALAFFTALFSMVGWLLKIVHDDKKETRDAKRAAIQAAESAKTVEANTKNVSNGFASGVLGKLQRIEDKVDDVATAQREHLEWHLEREKK